MLVFKDLRINFLLVCPVIIPDIFQIFYHEGGVIAEDFLVRHPQLAGIDQRPHRYPRFCNAGIAAKTPIMTLPRMPKACWS
jgi:hypothetical protein